MEETQRTYTLPLTEAEVIQHCQSRRAVIRDFKQIRLRSLQGICPARLLACAEGKPTSCRYCADDRTLSCIVVSISVDGSLIGQRSPYSKDDRRGNRQDNAGPVESERNKWFILGFGVEQFGEKPSALIWGLVIRIVLLLALELLWIQ
jgi:hypothetical protein